MGTINKFTLSPTYNGQPAPAVPAVGKQTSVVLVGGTAQDVAIPTGAKTAIFSSSVDFWVNFEDTADAVIPVASGDDKEILNPVCVDLAGAFTPFSMISTDGGLVSIRWFS